MANLNARLAKGNNSCSPREFVDRLIQKYGEALAYLIDAEMAGHILESKVTFQAEGFADVTFGSAARKPGLPPKWFASADQGTTGAAKLEEPRGADGTEKTKVPKSPVKRPEAKPPEQAEPKETDAEKDSKTGQSTLFENAD